MNVRKSAISLLVATLSVVGSWSGPASATEYNSDQEGGVTITTVASGDSLIGSGTATYSSTNTGTQWELTKMNATAFTGTEIFTKGRFKVSLQSNVGSSETTPTIQINSGAQMWLISNPSITANVTIAGHGTNASNQDGMGAIRFEQTSELKGTLTLAADATISTFYHSEDESKKKLASTVALEGHTLYLGASPSFNPNQGVDRGYWVTGMTLSGKISGDGKIIINNTSGKSNFFFSNTENDFTAPIEILHGSLRVDDVRALGKTAGITVKNSGNLNLTAGSGTTTGLTVTLENGSTAALSGSLTAFTNTTVSVAETAVLSLKGEPTLKVTGTGTIKRNGEENYLTNVDASGFHGTVDLVKDRTKITKQANLGANDVTVNVPAGAQLWLYNTNVTGTFNIAGAGYGAANTNGLYGAIRLECNSSVAGQINLLADATISTWYNKETSKKISANVNLGEYTLSLGAPDTHNMGAWIPTETQNRQFTLLTVTGKISGSGGLHVNNQKAVKLQAVNDYTGPTTLQYGTLSLEVADAIATSSSVSVAADGILSFTADQTLQNLTGAGTVTGAAGKNLTLKYTGTGSGSFTGVITLGEGGELTYVNESQTPQQIAVNKLSTETLEIGFTSNDADGFLVDSFKEGDVEEIKMKDLTGSTSLWGLNYPILTSTNGLPAIDWASLLSPESGQNWYLYTNGNTLYAAVDGNTVPEPAAWLLLLLGAFFLRRAGRR